jgi:hypothetical protein
MAIGAVPLLFMELSVFDWGFESSCHDLNPWIGVVAYNKSPGGGFIKYKPSSVPGKFSHQFDQHG